MKLQILSFCIGLVMFLIPSAEAVTLSPISQAWIRTQDSMQEIKVSPKGRYVAYRSEKGQELKVLDLSTRNIYLISKNYVGSSFFWAPGDFRLFFKEMGQTADKKVISYLQVYDCLKKESVLLESLPYETGTLTYDPRDQKMYLLHQNGIHAKKLHFPNNRLARWQKVRKENLGQWVASPGGILWVSRGGLRMRNMVVEGARIESFDLSPDGKSAAWSTKEGEVFVNHSGAKTIKVGPGRHPTWHPTKNILLYVGARKVGPSVSGYDLKIYDHHGRHKWVTQTPYSDEAWPQWSPDGQKVIYTKDRTTDLYSMVFLR